MSQVRRRKPSIAATSIGPNDPAATTPYRSGDRLNFERRRLLAAAIAAALAPRLAFAQQADRVYRIGWLTWGGRSLARYGTDDALRVLEQAGFVKGKNLVLELRAADDGAARVEALAAELAAAKLDAIMADTADAALALARATASTPIVAVVGPKPPPEQFNALMLRRPGNLTGVTYFDLDAVAGCFEILQETFPSSRRLRVITQTAAQPWIEPEARGAARMGMSVEPAVIDSLSELEMFFARPLQRDQAVYVAGTRWNSAHRMTIVTLANQARAPIVYPSVEFAEAGGLIACFADYRAALNRATQLLLRILNGTRPAQMPVEKLTRVYVIINRTTAKALDITIPPAMLARADRVIE